MYTLFANSKTSLNATLKQAAEKGDLKAQFSIKWSQNQIQPLILNESKLSTHTSLRSQKQS